MLNIIDYFKDHMVILMIIGGLILIVIYSMFAVFLNSLNSLKHGKPTILSWIPGTNIFMLGKLAVNWVVGLILFVGLLFGICISFKIKGLESIYNLMPRVYVLAYQIAYGILLIIMFVIGKYKENKIIREGTGIDAMNTFINKNFDNKGPTLVGTTEQVRNIEEGIKDDIKYNHTSLSSLSKLNDTNKHDQN